MQQAFNEKERDVQEPASIHLRVVHSSRIAETTKTPASDEEPGQPASAQPAHRHGIKTHYGRSYHPDGPAGNYQGL